MSSECLACGVTTCSKALLHLPSLLPPPPSHTHTHSLALALSTPPPLFLSFSPPPPLHPSSSLPGTCPLPPSPTQSLSSPSPSPSPLPPSLPLPCAVTFSHSCLPSCRPFWGIKPHWEGGGLLSSFKKGVFYRCNTSGLCSQEKRRGDTK